MELTTAQIEQLVDQIVLRLTEREQRVCTLTLDQLREKIAQFPQDGVVDSRLLLDYATLSIQQVDLNFIHQLIQTERQYKEIEMIYKAWEWGVKVNISLHQQLFRALPCQKLATLPITICDQNGAKVQLFNKRILSYVDVATCHAHWILVGAKTQVTPLAKDYLSANQITLLKQE